MALLAGVLLFSAAPTCASVCSAAAVTDVEVLWRDTSARRPGAQHFCSAALPVQHEQAAGDKGRVCHYDKSKNDGERKALQTYLGI